MPRALPSWESSLSCSAVQSLFAATVFQQKSSWTHATGASLLRVFDCAAGGHILLRIFDESYRATHKATARSVTLPSTFVSQLSLRQENKTTVNCYSGCRQPRCTSRFTLQSEVVAPQPHAVTVSFDSLQMTGGR